MKQLLLYIALLLIPLTARPQFPQPTLDWERCYGGAYGSSGPAIRLTADGGYIMAGATHSNDGDVSNNPSAPFASSVWVVKLDTDGDIEWEQCYGGSENDAASDVQQTIDGGYIVAGRTTSSDGDVSENKGLDDYWVFKLESDGTLEWEQTYGGSQGDVAHSIEQTTDGGYVLVGRTVSTDGDVTPHPNGATSIWVVKLDSAGDIEWEQTYYGDGINASIRQTTDGGYIVSTQYQTPTDVDIWIFKLEANGTLEWEQHYGTLQGAGVINPNAIRQTIDGGYIITGGLDTNAWLFKIDSTGTMEWDQVYGGSMSDGGFAVLQTHDGGYITAATTWSDDGDIDQNQGGQDVWVYKTDPDGKLLWSQTYGGSGHDLGSAVLEVNCGYIVLGNTSSQDGDIGQNPADPGSSSLWVLKLHVDIDIPPPGADSPQVFCGTGHPTLGDITVEGDSSFGLPVTFSWYASAGPAMPLPPDTPLEDGTSYYVSQTIGGCEGEVSGVTVAVTPDMPPDGEPEQEFCDGGGITLEDLSVTGQGLRWYMDENTGMEIPPATAPENGVTYWVTQTLDGCESSPIAIAVTLGERPVVSLTDLEKCRGETLAVTPVVSHPDPETLEYHWYEGGAEVSDETSLTVTELPGGSATYTVEVFEPGAEDCRGEATVQIRYYDNADCIIPQGISPTATTGMNDTFDLQWVRDKSDNQAYIRVYNRYGTLVYEEENYADQWDGRTNDGERLPVGMYFYRLDTPSDTFTGYVYVNY